MADRKRLKLANNRGLKFIPVAVDFGSIKVLDDDFEFDPSDLSSQANKMYDDMEYDTLIVHILYNLSDREKIVFLYQILRDYGHKIDTTSLAKTLKVGRTTYHAVLNSVKKKVAILTSRTNNAKKE